MIARNPWDFATPLDARALGAMAWAPPQLPLFPPQAGDNAGAGHSPSDLERAGSAALLGAMSVFDRGLPVSGLGMSLPVVGLHPPADASATDGSNGFLNFTTSQSPSTPAGAVYTTASSQLPLAWPRSGPAPDPIFDSEEGLGGSLRAFQRRTKHSTTVRQIGEGTKRMDEFGAGVGQGFLFDPLASAANGLASGADWGECLRAT